MSDIMSLEVTNLTSYHHCGARPLWEELVKHFSERANSSAYCTALLAVQFMALGLASCVAASTV
jgi:hypothetical protein